ncbi:DNA ligase D [Chitinimonas koreensis]|uniref:DNA ligase D n=1 Tax=Chitinimonas koreensis TaxID=356302 RepID=UPI000411C44C|nr:DNA ligase D [Chitinimonas koreensis]QNM97954.1 DNA ligase D [Chitinimonas koreensis]
MGLEKYRRKRDFARTPEPEGEERPSGPRLAYVIQQHAARKLHYDFRLELDGTLKSWAVPRGPSLDPAQKRLAVEVEDHPLDYGGFEGVIPARQYGAGTVMLWDRGEWLPDGDPAEGYRRGRLEFRLRGEKLAGGWTLVRIKAKDEERQTPWLLIKRADAEAREGPEAEITERLTRSVLSRRSLAQIAARSEAEPPAEAPAGSSAMPACRAPMPDFIEPQLASLVERAPHGGDWLAELKYDGYRILARVDRGEVQIRTRNRKDWTARMPELARALGGLGDVSAWLDGEVVALDARGEISFQALQQAFPKPGERSRPARLVYLPFDLPWLDGEDLRGLPQRERKRRLEALLAALPADAPVRYSAHLDEAVEAAFRHACLHGQEGLILKRADAPYAAGRSSHWLKLKCGRRQEFVIGGYTDPKGSRIGFGALLVGYYAHGRLRYAGRVGTGFDHGLLTQLTARLQALRRADSPFDGGPAERGPTERGPTERGPDGFHWVEPECVAEVRFAGWTEAGLLRQAAFVGLREDKPARAVTDEVAVAPPEADAADRPVKGMAAKGAAAAAAAAPDQVAGVAISHPDRVLFADVGLGKIGLARYYAAVAERLLPQLHDRPLSLVRCPRGPAQPCFFQKHFGEAFPATLLAVEVEEGSGESARYMVANDLAAVIGLVQMGVLEFHTWGARRDRLDRPDRMIFDLDPAPDLPWQRVVEAAGLVRALLEELGLACFLKTTGGKGLHVETPLTRHHDWDTVKGLSQRIARHLAVLMPDRFVATAAKQRRTGRIFIDWLRNAEGATAVAAYSVRARPGAPVAVPIEWDELADGVRADRFDVRATLERLRRQRQDPWAGYEAARRRITAEMTARLD